MNGCVRGYVHGDGAARQSVSPLSQVCVVPRRENGLMPKRVRLSRAPAFAAEPRYRRAAGNTRRSRDKYRCEKRASHIIKRRMH